MITERPTRPCAATIPDAFELSTSSQTNIGQLVVERTPLAMRPFERGRLWVPATLPG
jgi:hypothetical protein